MALAESMTMQHLCAFGFSATNTGAGVFVNIPAKLDSYLTVNANNRFILPPPPGGQGGPWRIAAAFAQGPTQTVARVNNATLRRIGLPSIYPTNPALAVPSAFNVPILGFNGPKLPQADEFGVEGDSTAIEVQTAGLWLHDGVMNGPSGEVFPLQFSATVTTVANTWTLGTITFAQSLPVGRYAVHGMDLIGTTLIFARLVFPDGGPRPGILARASSAILPQNQFRNGAFGKFGEFSSYAQPMIEIFASSAAAITFTGCLDLQKVG